MFNGKLKAVTFSYDDGILQDVRLIKILNKYGLKGTFNLNSGRFGNKGSLLCEEEIVNHTRIKAEDVKTVYAGHEIAAHTVTHPQLYTMTPQEVFREVEEDREFLSELAGYEIVGMAYPGGTYNATDMVKDVIKNKTGIKYARTTTSTYSFDLQEDLVSFNPTVHHHREWEDMLSLGRKFVELKVDKPQIFYIWGHAYEFDIQNTWDRFEEFCKMISGHSDIFYGTNKEILLQK